MKKDTPFIKQEVLIKNIQNMTTETKEESKKVIMKAGRRYKLCTCGVSKILPLCDDSHRELNEKEGTNYKSIKILNHLYFVLKISNKCICSNIHLFNLLTFL